MQNIILFLIK